MPKIAKFGTRVCFETDLLHALRLKAAQSQQSLSSLVNDAVRQALRDDEEDLQAFKDRAQEKTLSYAALLKALKAHGKYRN